MSPTSDTVVRPILKLHMGRSEDVPEEKQDFCCKARSATEGFIAVAKKPLVITASCPYLFRHLAAKALVSSSV